MGVLWSTTRFVTRQCVRGARTGLRALSGPATSHGSARWATSGTLRRAGLFGEFGLIVGKARGRLLRYPSNEGHVLVFAPTGAGKGIGIVVPNLLDYRGSVVCTDIKGENYAITARRRRDFGPVYRLDVGDPETSHHFNPLGIIRRDTWHEADDAEVLANLIIAQESGTDDHWRIRARDWLTAIILHVLEVNADEPLLQTLTEVHALASRGPGVLAERFCESRHPRVQEAGFQLATAEGSEECQNVFCNITKNTAPWSAARPLARICQTTDIAIDQLYERPQSLYVIVPEEKLGIYGGFLRVVVGCAMYAVYRPGRERLPGAEKPLFVLDEAAALGNLPPLEEGIGYLRSYARTILVFQDLGQLTSLYRKARSLVANTSCHVAFAVNDLDTAKSLSERIGMRTIESRSVGFSQESHALFTHRDNDGRAETGRWLIDASEVLRLAPHEALVTMKGLVPEPIRAERLDYRKEPHFAGQWDRWRGLRGDIPVTSRCGTADDATPAPAGVAPAASTGLAIGRSAAPAEGPIAGHPTIARQRRLGSSPAPGAFAAAIRAVAPPPPLVTRRASFPPTAAR
ncbi:MAG: TraM recognition domain-containing protein [Rhizobiales bacterium]|nr:TraM recognition domain-containing protein [Hyphomicrobiales bacterium]